jgi:membrane associated rhomboid family serine protease
MLTDQIKKNFKQGNSLIKLIYINAAVFVLVTALIVTAKLFNFSAFSAEDYYLAMPSQFSHLAERFWTPLTYMFFHKNIFHIFFNMLCLYWFGLLFVNYFTEKQLVSLYVFGGLFGAVLYFFAYNYVPYYTAHYGLLLGASGSIMAIIVAVAMYSPNAEMYFFLWRIKLKYIALGALALSFLGLTGDNGGGQVAHIGGALGGWLFVYFLKNKNKDITAWITAIIDKIVTLFRRREPKLRATKPNYSRMTDAEYNMNKAQNIAEIDKILDKIKASGYESLTTEEKKRLFEQGK